MSAPSGGGVPKSTSGNMTTAPTKLTFSLYRYFEINNPKPVPMLLRVANFENNLGNISGVSGTSISYISNNSVHMIFTFLAGNQNRDCAFFNKLNRIR